MIQILEKQIFNATKLFNINVLLDNSCWKMDTISTFLEIAMICLVVKYKNQNFENCRKVIKETQFLKIVRNRNDKSLQKTHVLLNKGKHKKKLSKIILSDFAIYFCFVQRWEKKIEKDPTFLKLVKFSQVLTKLHIKIWSKLSR